MYYGDYERSVQDDLARLALEFELIPTGGSDFHGPGVKPDRPWRGTVVPPETVEALLVSAAETIQASSSPPRRSSWPQGWFNGLADTGKSFAVVLGKPMAWWSLLAASSADSIDEIVLVCGQHSHAAAQKLVDEIVFDKADRARTGRPAPPGFGPVRL